MMIRRIMKAEPRTTKMRNILDVPIVSVAACYRITIATDYDFTGCLYTVTMAAD